MAKKPCTHNPLRFYCDSLLSSRHEHDHFPRPRYLDGTDVVPACLNCHDLKDWQPLKNWDPDTYDFETLFTSMPPLAGSSTRSSPHSSFIVAMKNRPNGLTRRGNPQSEKALGEDDDRRAASAVG